MCVCVYGCMCLTIGDVYMMSVLLYVIAKLPLFIQIGTVSLYRAPFPCSMFFPLHYHCDHQWGRTIFLTHSYCRHPPASGLEHTSGTSVGNILLRLQEPCFGHFRWTYALVTVKHITLKSCSLLYCSLTLSLSIYFPRSLTMSCSCTAFFSPHKQ